MKKIKGLFATRAITEEIPVELQGLLWKLFMQLRKERGDEHDYLQLFHVEKTENELIICNQQEVPEMTKAFRFPATHTQWIGTTKIWIITEEENATMLFPSDY